MTATDDEGSSSRRRRRWRSGLAVGAFAVLAVLAWAAVVADHLVHADRALRAGVAASQTVRTALGAEGIGGDSAGTALASAHADFASAHGDVASGWLAPLRIVPILDTQVRSVQDLSAAAATVTGAGRTTLTDVHDILAAPHSTPAARAGAIRRLATQVTSLSTTVDGVSLGPRHGLLPTLVAKRDTFADDLGTVEVDLDKARGATTALARILAGPPTPYLVVATNNAEMRDGSGMMLEAGTLTFHDGAATLTDFQPTSDLHLASPTVTPTGDLAARWGFARPATDFRSLMLSPQFPANASLAARMWAERTGVHVDGVITIDIGALADLLTATGPVSLDGTTYTAADVDQELLVDQYAGEEDDQITAARHQRLGVLARMVLDRVQDGQVPITALAAALDQAVDGRHLMAWSAVPAVETGWTDAGAGGAVGGDDLLLGVLNESGDKLDPYLQVSSQLTVAPGRTTTAVTVRVTVRNATPPGLTGYAAGGGAGTAPIRQYDGDVSLDFPTYAGYAHATGGPLQAVGADYGADVLAVEIFVPDGMSSVVTFHLTLDGAHGTLEVMPSARLPATRWSTAGPGVAPSAFTDATAHAVTW